VKVAKKGGRVTAQQEIFLLREQVHRLRVQGFATGTAKVGQILAKWGMLALIAYFLHDPLVEWAGKDTTAHISIDAHGKLESRSRIEQAFEVVGAPETTALLGVIFGMCGVIYGLREARLRRRVREELLPYKLIHERMLEGRPSQTSATIRAERAQGTS